MRRAAGAGVAALDRDDADRRRKPLRVLPKRDAFEVILSFIDRRRDRRVFGGKAVRKRFDLCDPVVSDRFVQIERRVG